MHHAEAQLFARTETERGVRVAQRSPAMCVVFAHLSLAERMRMYAVCKAWSAACSSVTVPYTEISLRQLQALSKARRRRFVLPFISRTYLIVSGTSHQFDAGLTTCSLPYHPDTRPHVHNTAVGFGVTLGSTHPVTVSFAVRAPPRQLHPADMTFDLRLYWVHHHELVHRNYELQRQREAAERLREAAECAHDAACEERSKQRQTALRRAQPQARRAAQRALGGRDRKKTHGRAGQTLGPVATRHSRGHAQSCSKSWPTRRNAYSRAPSRRPSPR
jgi:hypothetical protein